MIENVVLNVTYLFLGIFEYRNNVYSLQKYEQANLYTNYTQSFSGTNIVNKDHSKTERTLITYEYVFAGISGKKHKGFKSLFLAQFFVF